MDWPFAIAVGALLCLLSGLLAARLRAAGVSARRRAVALLELWGALGLWAGVFWAISSAAGTDEVTEAREAAERLAALPARALAWAAAGVAASVGVVVHLLVTVGRLMRGEP